MRDRWSEWNAAQDAATQWKAEARTMTYNTYTYKRLRREGYGARYALQLARIDAALTYQGEDWRELDMFGPERIGRVRWDWDDYDGSDDDWLDDDQRHLYRSIYVTLDIVDRETEEEVCSAAVGGAGLLLTYDGSDGFSEAEDVVLSMLCEYLVPEASCRLRDMDLAAEREAAESRYWAERDVMTVGASNGC